MLVRSHEFHYRIFIAVFEHRTRETYDICYGFLKLLCNQVFR